MISYFAIRHKPTGHWLYNTGERGSATVRYALSDWRKAAPKLFPTRIAAELTLHEWTQGRGLSLQYETQCMEIVTMTLQATHAVYRRKKETPDD